MNNPLLKTTGFVNVWGFEAIYRDSQGEQRLPCEVRIDETGQGMLFTRINGQDVRTASVYDFVIDVSSCISFRIEHKIGVWLDGTSHPATFVEEFIRAIVDERPQYHCRFSLIIGETAYTTEECDAWIEAMWELSDVIDPKIQQWRFQTCFGCNYCGFSFPFPTEARDLLRCYRDAPPELFAEAMEKRKQASRAAVYSGHYFVNAFHTCAAWQLSRPPQKVEKTDR